MNDQNNHAYEQSEIEELNKIQSERNVVGNNNNTLLCITFSQIDNPTEKLIDDYCVKHCEDCELSKEVFSVKNSESTTFSA